MRCKRLFWGVALVGTSAGGCNGLVAEPGRSGGGDSASSTGPNTDGSAGETPVSSTGTSRGSDVSSTGSSGSSSAAGGTDPTTTTTDDRELEPRLEVVVQRSTRHGGLALELCTIEDASRQSCTPLHRPDTQYDWYPQFMPARRLLLEARDNGSITELHVVSLDDPMASTRIDVGTEPPGIDSSQVFIAADASVVYSYDDTAYRVELDGIHPGQVSALLEHRGQFRPALDPQGRFALFDRPCPGPCDTVRVWFDGGEIESIAPWGKPWLTRDGNRGFEGLPGTASDALEIREISDLSKPPVTLLETPPGNLFTGQENGPWLVRPSSERPGIVVFVGLNPRLLYYVGFDGDAALDPVALAAPDIDATVNDPVLTGFSPWSPDGRWLVYRAVASEGSEIWVADFGSGHLPTLHSVPLDSVNASSHPFDWAPDSSAFFWSDSAQTQRISLGAPSGPVVQPIGRGGARPAALSADGATLVVTQHDSSSAGASSMHAVDVSGGTPGPPDTLAEAGPGENLANVGISDDGRYVHYTVVTDKTRLSWVVSTDDNRDTAVDVGETTRAWFVPSEDS